MNTFTLDNGAGLSLTCINRGGIVTALNVPDRDGRAANVVLRLPTLDDYAKPHPHLGTIVGRYANRIANGRFTLEGVPVQLPANDGVHTLHGGPGGFGTRWWDIAPLSKSALELRLVSDDGDQGFPGRLEVRVTYTLTPANEFRIDYEARCDRTTVVNLTHHDYFNLAGGGSILGHKLTIAASRYCTVGADLIPRDLAVVGGTPFDFRSPHVIGDRIQEAGGYDHNWVLDEERGIHFAARLEDPVSGRVMEVFTSEPGLQFYSGNFLDGSVGGLRRHEGLCLETQHFPDGPNRPDFPATVLQPGALYASTTVHRFTHL